MLADMARFMLFARKFENRATHFDSFGGNRAVHPIHRQNRPLPPPPLRVRDLAAFLQVKNPRFC